MVSGAMRLGLSAVVTVLGLGTMACDGDDLDGPDETVFGAELLGASEVPPVQTSASGTARFVLRDGTVSYRIEVVDVVNATAAHIHTGGAGVNGPIVVTLFTADPPLSIDDGVLVDDSFTDVDDGVELSLDDVLELMEDGGAYVNVHTTANPGGEIRGQITQQP